MLHDPITSTTSHRHVALRNPSRVRLAALIAAALLGATAATNALALPTEPFDDDLVGWSFDPNNPGEPPGPVDPGGGLPPLYATTPMVDARTDRSVTLSFHASADATVGVALERSAGRDGKFENVRCWNTREKGDRLDTVQQGGAPVSPDKGGADESGADVGGASAAQKGASEKGSSEKRGGVVLGDNGCVNGPPPASFVDAGLPRDELFCWRTRVWDAAGSSVASPSRCAYTRGFAGEAAGEPAVEPWRARLIVETGDASHADTDDDIRIGLNDHWNNTTPHGNATWLDYPHDDFERGDQFTYDLGLATLEDVHDITLLSIFNDGTDPWCVAHVLLEVDRDVLFEHDFSNEPGGCRWIGGDEAFTFSHDELRASPDWQAFASQGLGFTLEGNDIRSRIESAVGNLAHATELYWDEEDDGVRLSRVNDEMFHVDIETTAYADDWFDPTVQIDLDVGVEIACTPSSSSGFDVTIDFVPQNAHASAEGVLFEVGEFFSCGLEGEWNCIEEALDDELLGALPTFGGASMHLPTCPTNTIDEFSNITFSL